MKALTVKQPWAYLICLGIKDIENRSWKTNFRGKVLIHASSNKRLMNLPPNDFMTDDQSARMMYRDVKFPAEEWNLYSAIIGIVEIVDCVVNHPSIWAEKTIIEQMEYPEFGYNESEYFGDGEHECDRCEHTWWGNENKPIYNWILANPVLFDKPIENVKGKLGLWEYQSDIFVAQMINR
jgi:hypothetical protein